jgi:hypothetical protein
MPTYQKPLPFGSMTTFAQFVSNQLGSDFYRGPIRRRFGRLMGSGIRSDTR